MTTITSPFSWWWNQHRDIKCQWSHISKRQSKCQDCLFPVLSLLNPMELQQCNTLRYKNLEFFFFSLSNVRSFWPADGFHIAMWKIRDILGREQRKQEASIEKQRKQRGKNLFFKFYFQSRLLKSTSTMKVLKETFLTLGANFCWQKKRLLRIKNEGFWKSWP